MKITDCQPTRSFRIEDVKALDPIQVMIFNYEPGKGKAIIMQCYSKAWTMYWGAMGGKPLEEFFVSCGPDYISGCAIWPDGAKARKSDIAYLERIIVAVQEALRSILAAEAQAS